MEHASLQYRLRIVSSCMRLPHWSQYRGFFASVRRLRSAALASSNCTLASECSRASAAVRLRHLSPQRRVWGLRFLGRGPPQYRHVVGRAGSGALRRLRSAASASR